jgi:hypothetical protein
MRFVVPAAVMRVEWVEWAEPVTQLAAEPAALIPAG